MVGVSEGLDLSNLDQISQDEINANLARVWSWRGPLYELYANSLMLDFRTVIIPRFVYATGDAFEGDHITDKKVVTRIEQAVDELIRFTRALRG